MPVTRGNLISGPATDFKIGADGAEVDVGGTLGPVGFRKEVIHQEDRADQRKGVMNKNEDDVRYFVIATFAEITLENLRIGLNQASGNLSGSTLTFDEDENGEKSIVFTGKKNSSGGTRTYDFPVCVVHSIEPVTYGRQNQQALAIEFEVLQDASDGSFGTCADS